MHHFIYATKDSWISSGSNRFTGKSFTEQNFGQDEILELKKEFYNNSFDYSTRVLVSFSGTELTNVSHSVVSNTITNPKYYLRLYEAEGNSSLSPEYTLIAHPVSKSWVEGTGKSFDDPITENGVSWKNAQNEPGGTAVTWSKHDGPSSYGGSFFTGSGYAASQSFNNESPDVEMDVSDIVNGWFDGTVSQSAGDNYGMILKFSGSHEDASNSDGSITTGKLKFFSRQTNTVYSPRLEVRWDDHAPCSGSNTGSLLPLTMSGQADNTLYMKGLRDSYKTTEKVRFRIGARKRYVQKAFSTSVQTVTGSFVPEACGSYAIKDISTGETVIPFSGYTSMSCDPTSNYFDQWMNGFHSNRVYEIIYKLKYNDGQEVVFDDDFRFKVKE